ncbi:MAG: hypothetical protein JJ971_12940 [Balneolaceae bacterium]|nr:hypothetical protein [Balneolaceae bacterium]MBO6547241.1 hypothetical protein [Balneolaceae bacterium]MBO6647812.1 hypothetical protein [Balneolaceae bacterium]
MDLKKVNLFLLSGFYIIAGINHFINPEFYYPLIPDYLPFNEAINYGSGLVEILLGIGVLTKKTRTLSSYLLVVMLVSFIPAHIYFIQIGSCTDTGLCVPEWISWSRLIIIHPLLIAWALSVGRSES